MTVRWPPVSPLVETPGNLIANGSFESPGLTVQSVPNRTSVSRSVEHARFGAHSLQVDYLGGADSYASSIVPATGLVGQRLTLSTWVLVPSASGDKAAENPNGVIFLYTAGTGGAIQGSITSSPVRLANLPRDAWTRVAVTMPAVTPDALNVYSRFYSMMADGPVFFDGARLAVEDEAAPFLAGGQKWPRGGR